MEEFQEEIKSKSPTAPRSRQAPSDVPKVLRSGRPSQEDEHAFRSTVTFDFSAIQQPVPTSVVGLIGRV
jgi:hypothetical protein